MDRWETVRAPASPLSEQCTCPRDFIAPIPEPPKTRVDAALSTALPTSLWLVAATSAACAAGGSAVTAGILGSATFVTLPLIVCPPLFVVPLTTGVGSQFFGVSAVGLAALSAASGAAALALPLHAAWTANASAGS